MGKSSMMARLSRATPLVEFSDSPIHYSNSRIHRFTNSLIILLFTLLASSAAAQPRRVRVFASGFSLPVAFDPVQSVGLRQ